jgi:hypothetical protein
MMVSSRGRYLSVVYLHFAIHVWDFAPALVV